MIITEPSAIEKKSMEIISSELAEKNIILPPERETIIKRVIHCTADFSYAETLKFSDNAVKAALEALKNGCNIVTDTQMAKSGINKAAAAQLGCNIYCFMSDPDVAAEAKERGTTRAEVSMERAAKLEGDVIFAVGNAPTALLKLTEMIRRNEISPKLVVGVPVGFVNIIEAKEEIMGAGAEYIVNTGRKGGSNVAAAILNALMYKLTR